MTTSESPNQPPNTTGLQQRRRRVFKVSVTETWVEDQSQKEWKQIRDPETTARVEKDTDYAYVTDVLPTVERRTVLEAEIETIDVPALVRAVFGLDS